MTQAFPDIAPEYSRARRFKNFWRNAFTNPYNIMVAVSIVLLTYLIVVPLFDMISTTFEATQKISAVSAAGHKSAISRCTTGTAFCLRTSVPRCCTSRS